METAKWLLVQHCLLAFADSSVGNAACHLLPCCLLLQDVAAIRRCKRRVFQLHQQGKLQAWVDESHGYRGVQQVPDAIDYMLRGGHIGKVVIPIQ
jgi:hypothetical protein